MSKQMRTKDEILESLLHITGVRLKSPEAHLFQLTHDFKFLIEVLIDIRDIQYNKKVYMELKQKKINKEIKKAIKDLEEETEENMQNVHGKNLSGDKNERN